MKKQTTKKPSKKSQPIRLAELPLPPLPEDREIKPYDSISEADQKNTDTSTFSTGTRSNLMEKGASGTEVHGGYFDEEYLQKLRGPRAAKTYDEMRRSESQVSMLLKAMTNTIKAGNWEIEAAADVPNGEKHAALIGHIKDTNIDFETHLHEALTMLIFGYSVIERVDKVVFNDPKFGTYNGLKALAYRSQKTIERWNFNSDTGELDNVEQWAQGDTVKKGSANLCMPAEFLLIFTVDKEGDNYEGISLLRPMYGAWFRKNLYLKIAAIGAEKNAIGTPIGTIPAGKENDKAQKQQFEEALSNYTAHEAAYITVPEGWKVEMQEGKFDPSKIKELITLENTEMINAVVANFLALGMNGGGGAYALGQDLSDFFLTGLQSYANIVTGVWNRKLIPDMIKQNYGPQESYPKLKASGIDDKAGKELVEILKTLIDSKVIKPDDKLDAHARKMYRLPAADPATAREVEQPKPFMFNENPSLRRKVKRQENILMAESYKKTWDKNKDEVMETMQDGLKIILDNLKKQVTTAWNGASPSQRTSINVLNFPQKGLNEYKASLKEELAKVANDGLISAKSDTPWTKKLRVKMTERILMAAPEGGYFNSLPANIKKIVTMRANLIGESQYQDLQKLVAFQFSSSAVQDNLDQILIDIDDKALSVIDGSTAAGTSINAAAGNAVSSTFNEARLEWFFEPEVLATIESFTFYNEDPISDICNELDGQTWAVGDPDLDKYSPPLHHSCKSRLQPNEKGAEDNPEINRKGTPVTEKALNSITLCDCDYHLSINNIDK